MQKLVYAFIASCLLAVAMYLFAQSRALVDWFARNPTMYTESAGYLIPLIIFVLIFVFIGKNYNKISNIL